MKDDKIRNLMSGISDKYVAEYRAVLDKKAAEAATAARTTETAANTAETATATTAATRGDRRGRRRAPVFWRTVAACALLLIFLAGGLLLGRYLNHRRQPEPIVSPEVTVLPTVTPAAVPEITAAPTETPDATAMPTGTPVVTATPADTATSTAVVTAPSTDMPVVTVMPTGTPIITATPAATPVDTAAATAVATAVPTDPPAATPTETPDVTPSAEPYIETKLEGYKFIYDDSTLNYTAAYTGDPITAYFMVANRTLYFIGYAYNSESPLKEMFLTLNDDPTERACEGTFTPREDIAERAGYSVDNAARSGFGTEQKPLKLTGLRNSAGIYKLHLMARFEDGTVTEVASPILIVEALMGSEMFEYSEGVLRFTYLQTGSSQSDDPYVVNNAFLRFDDASSETFSISNLNLSLFSRCEIDYLTAPDWQPFVEGAMTEPAFIALKLGSASIGSGNDGPDLSRVLARATLTAPSDSDPRLSSDPDALVCRTAVIDLSDCTYTGSTSGLEVIYLSAYPSTSGPVYVSAVRFYLAGD